MKEFDYDLDYKKLDFTDEETRKFYRIGRGEQGEHYYTTKKQHHSHLQVQMYLNLTQALTLLLLTNVIYRPNLGCVIIILEYLIVNRSGYNVS